MADSGSSVTVYSAPWCVFCRMAKQYLDSKGIKYKDVNVDEDHTAAHYIMSKTGQAGIPVLEIGDDVILGFDKPKIDESLKKLK